MVRTTIVALVASIALCTPAAAQDADDDRAHELFDRGREAFAAAHYEQALQLFQRAYDASARPELLYNIGQSADRLRLDDVALDAFRRYLGSGPDAVHRTEVEARVAALERVHAADVRPSVTPPPSTSLPAAALAHGDEHRDVTSEGWFWPVVIGGGALVVAAIVVIAAVASAPSQQSALPGNVGGVVFALDGP